ncbi:probable RNA helicase SDE3 [Ziziphus jujuba]|uniref:Probable RNA helicase SDE3 n=1 Tax=Ziziphus jujuba TaxID=326968 RepID=A0A6P3YV13_ZIZJJ|nr:probable RNA helicase SDE3 [Ziziphus jujuba]
MSFIRDFLQWLIGSDQSSSPRPPRSSTSQSQTWQPSPRTSSSPSFSFLEVPQTSSTHKPSPSPIYPSASSSQNQLPSFSTYKPSLSSQNQIPSTHKPPPSPIYPSASSSQNQLPSFSTYKPSPSSQNQSPSTHKPPPSPIYPSASSSQNQLPTSSTHKPSTSSQNPLPNFKPTLREAPKNATNQEGKANYIWVEDDASLPLYIIPEDKKDLIKKDIVPQVLKMPLSPLTYKDYFAALLYAEDYYYEKWSEFEMTNVTLELQKAEISNRHNQHNKHLNGTDEKDEKIFVQFNMDALPGNRPFLLSRDLVFAKPSDSNVEPFKGVIFRLVRSRIVLVEFEDGFYLQHHSAREYDISFSFNRICLKRAHQALNAVSDNLLWNFLFPDSASETTIPTAPASSSHFHECNSDVPSIVSQILSIKGSPPYLVSGPLCVPERKVFSHSNNLSKTGLLVFEAIVQIYKSSPECRILLSAPSNSACDVLMRSLMKVIPESNMFRVNAAFRGKDEVPDDILSSCLYKEECFACPSLEKLLKFKVIFSTFMSSYRLHSEGIAAGHFSHIFLVDASFAIEPEALVTLANFADKNTAVVVTGKPGNSSSWVRSEIGRKKGLKISYFERLCECRPYRTPNPKFFADLGLS